MQQFACSVSIVFSLSMAALLAGCSTSSGSGVCNDAWSKAAKACPNAASNSQQQQFLQQCNSPQSLQGCASQASAWASCVKQTASFTCDSTGQPQAAGCDAQGNAFASCLLGSLGLDGGTFDFDAGTVDFDNGTPGGSDSGISPADAAPSRLCDGHCSIAFTSGSDWSSFAGTLMPDDGSPGASYSKGASLGPAREVCLSPSIPANCPATALTYTTSGTGWAAGSGIPQAHWIWRGDVVASAPADLQLGIFEKSFDLGPNPAGLIQIAADNFAQIFVNGLAVGAVGSMTDITQANTAHSMLTTFDLTAALQAGSNTITVVGQNAVGAFSGCGASPCTYMQNPAGVDFAGTLTSR
jgi:hypothetical protein